MLLFGAEQLVLHRFLALYLNTSDYCNWKQLSVRVNQNSKVAAWRLNHKLNSINAIKLHKACGELIIVCKVIMSDVFHITIVTG